MTSSFTVTPDAVVTVAEVVVAVVALALAWWHWDEKKEGPVVGTEEAGYIGSCRQAGSGLCIRFL